MVYIPLTKPFNKKQRSEFLTSTHISTYSKPPNDSAVGKRTIMETFNTGRLNSKTVVQKSGSGSRSFYILYMQQQKNEQNKQRASRVQMMQDSRKGLKSGELINSFQLETLKESFKCSQGPTLQNPPVHPP